MGITTLREGMPLGKEITLKEWQKVGEDGLSGGVTEICFYPTYKCNLNCYMCHVKTTRPWAENETPLSLEQLKDAFADVNDVKTMFYLGGEPFVVNGMMETIKFFDSKGMNHIISTNGTIMTESMAEELSKLKNEVNMQVSLNGSSENDDIIRGVPKAFEKTVETIKLLKKFGLQVWLHCVPVKENIDDLANVVRLGKDLEVDEVQFIFAQTMSEEDERETRELMKEWIGEEVEVGGYVGELGYSEEQLVKGVRAAQEEGKKIGMEVRWFGDLFGEQPEIYWRGTVRENETPVCQIHMMNPRTPVVGPEGNVYACTNINHVFGNIQDNSLQEIWDSEPMRAMRRGMVKDKLLPLCKRCPCVDII